MFLCDCYDCCDCKCDYDYVGYVSSSFVLFLFSLFFFFFFSILFSDLKRRKGKRHHFFINEKITKYKQNKKQKKHTF